MLVSGRLTVIGSVVPLTKHSRNLLPPTAPTAPTAPAARPPNPKCHQRLLSPTRRRRGSGTAITNNVDSEEDVGKVMAAVALLNYNHQSRYPCSSNSLILPVHLFTAFSCSSNSLILPLHLFRAFSCSSSGSAAISVSPHSICELVDGLAASSRNKNDINACNLFEGH